MKIKILVTALLFGSFVSGAGAFPVGSPQWFGQQRSLPENKQVLKSLTGKEDFRRLSPQVVEFAGQIVSGNLSGKTLDLRIVSRNLKADSLERTPRVDSDGGFYTLLKKGQSYDLFLKSSTGRSEKFAAVTIPQKGFPFFKRVFQIKNVP